MAKASKPKKIQPSRQPKNVEGGWWYEDKGGIWVVQANGGSAIRIHWTDLMKAARRCGRG